MSTGVTMRRGVCLARSTFPDGTWRGGVGREWNFWVLFMVDSVKELSLIGIVIAAGLSSSWSEGRVLQRSGTIWFAPRLLLMCHRVDSVGNSMHHGCGVAVPTSVSLT